VPLAPLGKSPFGLDELVYEVATGRCVPERFGKLGVIDEPVRIEGDPVVVCAVRDAIHDADPLGTFVHPETYAARAGRTIGARGPLRAADPPTDTAELPPCAFCEATVASSERRLET
jgi:hypothetical protein